MKNKTVIALLLILAVFLSSCGSMQNQTANETENSEESYLTISTPYADICVPEVFDGNVINEVTNEEPYTLVFKAKKDGTELFTLIFDGVGDLLMGTLIGESENTVIYMNIPALNNEDENYDTYCGYQEAVNTIMNHLAEDYTFLIDEIVESEDTTTFDIETSVVTLKYPNKWRDKVQVDVSDKGVKFSNDGMPLFDIYFAACEDGYLLGTYKDTPIYIVDYSVETDEQAAMQEDINVILQYLMEDSNFIIN